MNANLKLSDLMIKENMTMCWRGYISVWNIYMILYFSLVQSVLQPSRLTDDDM